MRRALIGRRTAFVLLVLIVGGGFLLYREVKKLEAVLGDPCSQEELRSAQSPSGMSKASVFRVNCGATTGFAYIVSLIGEGEKIDLKTDYIFSKSGLDDISVTWKNDNEIAVTYENTGRVFRKAVVWRGYDITYEIAGK